MSEQLITVGEATQRLGLTSSLPSNKCLTKAEFDELVAQTPESAPNGVYIMHKDGFLVTKENWTYSNEEASGVALKTNNCSFVIAKAESGNTFSNNSNLIDGCVVSGTSNIAKYDYSGKQNTTMILLDSTLVAYCAQYCRGYQFLHGVQGYLPSLGELMEANNHITEINECMSLIGGKLLYDGSSTDYKKWSSTQMNNSNAWVFNFKNKSLSSEYKGTTYTTRPFAPFK